MTLSRRRAVLVPILLLSAGHLRAQDTARARADTAVAHPPAPPPPWRFQFDLGFQDAKGNTDLTVGNGSFVAERRAQRHLIVNMKLDARYGRSNGVEAANDQKVRMRFDWNPKNVLSPFLGVDGVHDDIRKLALRTQVGIGANINLDVRDSSRTWLSAGFVFEHVIYTPAETLLTSVDHRRYLLRAATQRLVHQAVRFEAVARILPSLDNGADYLASFEASIRVALTRRMGFSTRFDWARDSRPVPGVQQDDRAVTAALSFTW